MSVLTDEEALIRLNESPLKKYEEAVRPQDLKIAEGKDA